MRMRSAKSESVAEAINCAVLSGDYRGGMEMFIDYSGGTGSWSEYRRRKRRSSRASPSRSRIISGSSFGERGAAPWPAATSTFRRSFLCGANSPGPSQLIARLLADTIPHARHRVIADASHMSPITHPAQVNR